MDKKKEITTFHIKLLAIITMLIDHIGAAIIEPLFWNNPTVLNIDYYLIRSIGRLSFPLFILLLVDGFFYTRSRVKYLIRLLVFAGISEIPFDIAFYTNSKRFFEGNILDFQAQNVFITLCLGFMCMWLLDIINPGRKARFDIRKDNQKFSIKEDKYFILKLILCVLVIAAFSFIANLISCDYGYVGVIAISICYFARVNTDSRGISLAAADLTLAIFMLQEAPALLNLIPIRYYKGAKGKETNKYFFYIFYPLHLLLLGLFRILILTPLFK